MNRVSVSRVEKVHEGPGFNYESIRSLNHAYVQFPMDHILFDYIAKTVDDYMYYVDGGGCVWRKIKYKEEFYYYDSEYQNWVFDDEMCSGLMKNMSEHEFICRLVK